MNILYIRESGYSEAIMGMAYSHGLTSPYDDPFDIPMDIYDKIEARAARLATMDGGHNKFLESIQVWITIEASLKVWKQFDTYRVGMTKQSESTMHTILKKPLTMDNFHIHYDALPLYAKIAYKVYLKAMNRLIKDKKFSEVTDLLPSGFIQKRQICTNYKVLRNIYQQRKNHKLIEWKLFCKELYDKLEHPEFLEKDLDK
jgi:hypothetical protein